MVTCWMSKMGKVETENGSILKLLPYDCPRASKCLNYSSTVYTGRERMTKLGLLMEPNVAGPDLMLKFLRAWCHHPQKHEICMHIASLPVVDILIPNQVLSLIENVVMQRSRS